MTRTTYAKQEQEPASSEVTEVAPGVLRLQLPISMPGLGHVNCYALVDSNGVALVDPGLPGDESWSALGDRLKQAGIPLGRVHTTIVTHSHPDHYGGSHQLREETGAELLAHAAFTSSPRSRRRQRRHRLGVAGIGPRGVDRIVEGEAGEPGQHPLGNAARAAAR